MDRAGFTFAFSSGGAEDPYNFEVALPEQWNLNNWKVALLSAKAATKPDKVMLRATLAYKLPVSPAADAEALINYAHFAQEVSSTDTTDTVLDAFFNDIKTHVAANTDITKLAVIKKTAPGGWSLTNRNERHSAYLKFNGALSTLCGFAPRGKQIAATPLTAHPLIRLENLETRAKEMSTIFASLPKFVELRSNILRRRGLLLDSDSEDEEGGVFVAKAVKYRKPAFILPVAKLTGDTLYEPRHLSYFDAIREPFRKIKFQFFALDGSLQDYYRSPTPDTVGAETEIVLHFRPVRDKLRNAIEVRPSSPAVDNADIARAAGFNVGQPRNEIDAAAGFGY